MRVLASFCLAFAAGVGAAQYLLPHGLLLFAALGCAVLGGLWAASFHGNRRLRSALLGAGLALGLGWSWVHGELYFLPWESMAGGVERLALEAVDYPRETVYGCRVEVRALDPKLRGKAIYYGDAALLSLEPGDRFAAGVFINSAAVIRGRPVSSHTARGVFALLYARGGREPLPAGNRLRYGPQRFAHEMERRMDELYPASTGPLLKAMLLGDRFELSGADETALREAGLYHITAVSGLHCAFLLALIAFFLGRDKMRLLCAVSLPALFCYALMVGMTPSVSRAAVMLSLFLLAPVFEREADPPTSLSFALFLILLDNPFAVKSLSLQLSFAAMAGILSVSSRLYRAVGEGKRGRLRSFVRTSLTATAGALAFTAPLTAFHFNSLALVTPLSNLLCLWAAAPVFGSGLLITLLGMVCMPAARALAWLPHVGALYLLTAAKWLSRLPFHAVYFSNQGLRLWLIYVYAMVFVCVLRKAGRGCRVLAAGLAALSLAACLFCAALPLRFGSLHLTALDVGQGQCVMLHSKGVTALIDCGGSGYADPGGVAADYLQSQGLSRVELVVLSHYHEDHCNGLERLFSRLRVERLLLPDIAPEDPVRARVLALAEEYGVRTEFVRKPVTEALGAASLTVYPPSAEGEMNEECLSALCAAGDFEALFTGDMNADTEKRLLTAHPLPDLEVLMAGHHGSRSSTGADLLAAAKPEAAIVSCEAGNRYGHPNIETLRRLAEAEAAVYRTDLQGNIHIAVK